MKKTLTFIMACVLLLSLCSCGSIDLPDVGGSATDSKEYKPGETASVKDVAVTFIGVTETSGSQFLAPEDGNIFVLCEFEIVNNSNKELSISSMMSFDAYCDDSAISISLSALSAKGNKNQLDGTVAAGKKMSGVVGYEVPSDWKEIEIQFAPDIMSSSKITFVAGNN